jgi:glycerophosphoryl diester phosphodiesterase
MAMDNPFPRQLILGHRGIPRLALENTLRSFALALEAGADGVELDVQRTHDGQAAVIHDRTLDRTMGVKGELPRLQWGAIERLTGARLPSLQQVTAWAAAAGAWLNIEIKARQVEAAVVDRILGAGLADRVVISSFEPEILRRVGTIDGNLRRFFLTTRWDSRAVQDLELSTASGVCLRLDAATEAALSELRERHLPVIAWTVNEAAAVRRLLESGVAAIITDDPAMAAGVRSRVLAERPVA